MNATYWYSNFNDYLWLIFQGGFRNSTFLENLSNQLIQRSNKYYTRITFLVVLNVCVWVSIVNATLKRLFQFDCHERIKAETDLQRFVIVYKLKSKSPRIYRGLPILSKININ